MPKLKKHDKLCGVLVTSAIGVICCIMLCIAFGEQRNGGGIVGFFSLGLSLPVLVWRFYDGSIGKKDNVR